MPHPVPVDQVHAGVRGDVEHPTVHVLRNTHDEVFRCLAHTVRRPVPADHVGVAADAAGGQQHGLGAEFERPGLLTGRGHTTVEVTGHEGRAADAHRPTVFHDDLVHPVPHGEPHTTFPGGVADGLLEHAHHLGTGPPGDVEARHGVAVPGHVTAATLGPADGGHDPQPQVVEVPTLLSRRELDVGARPLAGPRIFRPVERGGAEPVAPGEFEGVLDADPALLGGVHHEQPAERPVGLPAEVLLVLLVHHQDLLARPAGLVGRNQPREAVAHHDHVRGESGLGRR